MNQPVKLYDGAALTEDLEEQGLRKGQVGTVIEFLDGDLFESILAMTLESVMHLPLSLPTN